MEEVDQMCFNVNVWTTCRCAIFCCQTVSAMGPSAWRVAHAVAPQSTASSPSTTNRCLHGIVVVSVGKVEHSKASRTNSHI